MGKLVKKLSVIVVCLSLVLGVMGVNGGVVAKASVNSDSIIVCNIYKSNENTVATIQVKVWKARYEAHGVTLAFSNGDDSTAKTYSHILR